MPDTWNPFAGNSGRVSSPHAADNLERWKAVEYAPLFVAWATVDIEAHKHVETTNTPRAWEEAAKL